MQHLKNKNKLKILPTFVVTCEHEQCEEQLFLIFFIFFTLHVSTLQNLLINQDLYTKINKKKEIIAHKIQVP